MSALEVRTCSVGAYYGAGVGAGALKREHKRKQQKQYLGTAEFKEQGALCGSRAHVYK
jgi:hypothetical protein